MKRELMTIAISAMLVAGCATQPVASTGPKGDKGVAGFVGQWTTYQDYTFAFNDARVQDSDSTKTAKIAAYMLSNPSLQLGLDGSMDLRGSDPRNQELSDRRVEAVRVALVSAGVPVQRIKVGAFGDPRVRRDRRVEVLFATAN